MTPHIPAHDLVRLREAARTFTSTPYLVTVTAELRPHCSVVHPDWDQVSGRPVVAAPSSWAECERMGHTAVTLLWPPTEIDGYSLIVDGTATTTAQGSEQRLVITPSRAVLHRPERVERPGSPCGADCVQIIPS